MWRADSIAEELWAKSGLDSSSSSVLTLAKALLGPGGVRTLHAGSMPGDGAIAKIDGKWRIYIRGQLPEDRLNFVIGHELAHLALGRGAAEEECDALAAALLVPAQALRAAIRTHGAVYKPLAKTFGTTQSCVALRIAEVTGTPTVLVTPRRVRVRGNEWSWPNEHALRDFARGRDHVALRRVDLEGEAGRVVLSPSDDAG